GVFDRLVLHQQVLDLAGVHVLAAGDNHVVGAAVDEQPPRGVEVADVAGAHQPADLLFALPAGVAGEGEPTADEDPPLLVRLAYPVAVLVGEAYPAADRRAADSGGRGTPVGRGGDRGDGDLGGAVQVVDHVAEHLGGAVTQLGGERRAGGEQDPQRGGVVPAE